MSTSSKSTDDAIELDSTEDLNDEPNNNDIIDLDMSQDIPTSSSPKQSATDSTTYVNNPKLFLSTESFLSRLQDKGVMNDDKLSRHISHEGYQYKHIYKLAKELLSIYQDKNHHFVDGAKKSNQYNRIHALGKWILSNRKLVDSAEITSDMRKIVDCSQDEIYSLDQKLLIRLVYQNWVCTSSNSLGKKTIYSVNIRARIYGLLFHEDHRDHAISTLFLSRNHCRPILDDKSVSLKNIFKSIYLDFGNENKIIKHPVGWEQVIQSVQSNSTITSPNIENYQVINPNDPILFQEDYPPDILMKIYQDTKSLYKTTMKKWTLGTGGGPGSPKDFAIWDQRDPLYLSGYSCRYGPLLTWMYLYDKIYHYPMKSSADLITCGSESGFSQLTDANETNPNPSQPSDPYTQKTKEIDKKMDSYSKMLFNHLEDSKKRHFSEITELVKTLNQKQDQYVEKTKVLLDSVNSCNAIIDRLTLDINNETNQDLIEIKQKRIKKVEATLENLYEKFDCEK